jgi:hypothetical protein
VSLPSDVNARNVDASGVDASDGTS